MTKKEKSSRELLSDSEYKLLEKSMREMIAIFKATENEIKVIQKKLAKDPEHQYWCRSYARAIYSHIEAICFRMKQITYIIFSKKGKLTSAEVAMLRDDFYYLTDKGKAQRKENRPGAASNLKFALKIFARTIQNKIFVLDGGWDDYLKGKEIRDRITHPKSVSALNISKEEVKKLDKAFKWFQEKFNQLIVIEKVKADKVGKK